MSTEFQNTIEKQMTFRLQSGTAHTGPTQRILIEYQTFHCTRVGRQGMTITPEFLVGVEAKDEHLWGY